MQMPTNRKDIDRLVANPHRGGPTAREARADYVRTLRASMVFGAV